MCEVFTHGSSNDGCELERDKKSLAAVLQVRINQAAGADGRRMIASRTI